MSAIFILHEERKKLQTFPALNEVDFWISTLGFRFSKRTEVPSQRSRTDGIQFLSTQPGVPVTCQFPLVGFQLAEMLPMTPIFVPPPPVTRQFAYLFPFVAFSASVLYPREL